MARNDMTRSGEFFRAEIEENGDIVQIVPGVEYRKVGIDNEREKYLILIQQDMQEAIEVCDDTLTKVRQYLIDTYNDKEMVDRLAAYAPVKTSEEIAQENAREQMRIVQEAAQEQIRIAQEQAAQQAQINQATYEAMMKFSETNAQLGSALQQSNETVSKLQKTVEEMMIRERNYENDRPIPAKRGDAPSPAGESKKQPAKNSTSNGILPGTDSKSSGLGPEPGSKSIPEYKGN